MVGPTHRCFRYTITIFSKEKICDHISEAGCLADKANIQQTNLKLHRLGYSWKNPNKGVEDMNFQAYQRYSMQNFQGLIKHETEFPGVTKKK